MSNNKCRYINNQFRGYVFTLQLTHGQKTTQLISRVFDKNADI